MKHLIDVHFVQFYLWDYETFHPSARASGAIGANGAGKTSLGDGIQAALVGGHGQYLHFNAQSVQKDSRSLRDYALGMIRSGHGDKTVVSRKRDEALTYITLVFRSADNPADIVSAGICFHSRITERHHRPLGLYVLPGVHLSLEHHLETVDNDARRPIAWDVFEAQARNLSAHAGRTCTITVKPETYIAELMHNLQHPGLHINTRVFLRAFSHSINLKHVGSVGDFLRGYLVEATAIDKQGTLRHMQSLRTLQAQIAEVKQQIVDLGSIEKRYKTLASHLRSKCTAEAVRAQLQYESHASHLDSLDDEIEKVGKSIAKQEERLGKLQESLPQLRNTYQQLLSAFSVDPEVLKSGQAASIHEAKTKAAGLLFREIERLQLSVRIALSSLYSAWEKGAQEEAKAVAALIHQWDGRAERGEVARLEDIQQVMSMLKNASEKLDGQISVQTGCVSEAKKSVDAVTGKISASQRGFHVSDDAAATAMLAFERAGIGAQPVGSLVSVTSPEWRCAIESFLKRNRFSIVVDSGREKDAVRILRKQDIREVTVVMPSHVSDWIGRAPKADSVAALIEGGHPVALAYLRQLLGNMRQAETEDELERYPRALTRDCMLSANGGTKGIRKIPEAECMLGRRLSTDDKAELQAAFQVADAARTAAQQHLSLLKVADEQLRATVREVSLERFSNALSDYQTGKAEADATKPVVAEAMSEHLKALKDQVENAKGKVGTTESEIAELLPALGGDRQKHVELVAQRGTTQQLFDDSKVQIDEIKKSVDYEYDDFEKLYSRCFDLITDEPKTGPAEVLTLLVSQIRGAESRISSAEAAAAVEFTNFVNARSMALQEERSEWRKAAVWVTNRIEMLQTSTLGQYEKEAEEARAAAEVAFQADVKFKIREACAQVKKSINDLNRILDTCPAFTGGEKYEFLYSPSPAHENLLRVIMDQTLDFQPGSMFAQPGMQEQVSRLLDNCQNGLNVGDNPFEDYRLFYNFDLKILVDGKVVDLLSNRMGVASNGEHRVPFYVIAGAALANAYRIKDATTHQGVGIMILDEAFYGIDAQNSFATMEFLNSLGLQVILAGPDTDLGKLLPLMDTYYELIRPNNSTDVFADYIVVKEPTRRALLSDMPDRNPELVERAVAQMSLVMP